MANRNERMEKLNMAGIDTGKYFTIDLKDGLPAGAKIRLVIDDNGQPAIMQENEEHDTIYNQIIEDGYVRNTKLHRRFVMAQMFQMLNYVSYSGNERGYHACLKNRYGYGYTLDMMLEEVRVLSKLEVRDRESFNERSKFFTKEVIVAVLEDYLAKLKNYIENLPNHNCKGVPYKKVKGVNIFNDDLHKKVYAPIDHNIRRIRYSRNYYEIYNTMCSLMRNVIKLPYDTPKSKVWIDTFKGEGAFYTLKNLVMFHECRIYTGRYGALDYSDRTKFSGVEAVNYLNRKLDEYQGEGWRMFALMKKVIEDNNFDFYEKMDEIYNG